MSSKLLTLITTFCLLSLQPIAQTTSDKIKKLANDSATKERAAKADVYVIKKSIFDTAVVMGQANKTVTSTKKTPAQKAKSKNVKKKTCTSTCCTKKKSSIL